LNLVFKTDLCAGLEIDIASEKVDKPIFEERKVENNAIDYRLQSIFPALELEINSEKVETNRYSIKGK